MQVAVFHPGTQHSWQTALALQELGRLAWYATSIFYQPDRFPYRLERILPGPLGQRLHQEFRRFAHPALDPARVWTVGWAEWFERVLARAGQRRLARAIDAFGNRRFATAIAKEVESTRPFALWGYSGSSHRAFELAKRRGRKLILDRTIGDFRAYNELMACLQADFGEWFTATLRSVPRTQIMADQREYELADTILVGSATAGETVAKWGGAEVAEKIRVMPYCYDELLFGNQPPPMPVTPAEPVRFLFVGQISPRKGIHHLLEAFARLPRGLARLTVVGDLMVPRAVFARYADRIDYLPTVARGDIPAVMARHHVLVFPSYFEGSALSLLEALASGLAIVQTRAAGQGGTSATGIVLDHPDTDALHAALMVPILDRERLDSWRTSARQEAEKYTFARYRDNIAALVDELAI